MTQLKSRPLRPVQSQQVTTIEARPDKTSFISAVYSKKLVEASWATEMLSDKRVVAEIFARELGDDANKYYPRTLGLREFLAKHGLIDAKGEIKVAGDAIEEALHQEFPAGFVARPAVGVAPRETGKGLFKDTDLFVIELLKKNSSLYNPAHFKKPVTSHILGRVSSGEAVVLQEDIVGAADARKALKNRFFSEVRIHTFENRVVEDAVPSRWVQTDLLTQDEVAIAEAFVTDLLKRLPPALLTRQAWGVDVAVLDNGDMRVIDVLTNRGEKIQWSSYLDQPRVIAAYAKHFEKHAGVHFIGFTGSLIRNGFANYFTFWGKRIEKARPGVSKVLAYFPPVP
ncbi:MAG: hypothetical protein V4760_16080 [Bdellovibrionota bacterium]